MLLIVSDYFSFLAKLNFAFGRCSILVTLKSLQDVGGGRRRAHHQATRRLVFYLSAND